MHKLVRCQSLAAVELERSTAHVGNLASRFLHDQHTRRRIPRIEVEFPEPLATPAGDTAQVKCSRSGAPHSSRAQRDLMLDDNIRILAPRMAGENESHQAIRALVWF